MATLLMVIIILYKMSSGGRIFDLADVDERDARSYANTIWEKTGYFNVTKWKDENGNTRTIYEARQRYLHNQKLEYQSNNVGVSKTSYTLPYCYENYTYAFDEVTGEDKQKTIDAVPIGQIVVTYELFGEEMSDMIIVCVKITDSPCSNDANYNKIIPESYIYSVYELDDDD